MLFQVPGGAVSPELLEPGAEKDLHQDMTRVLARVHQLRQSDDYIQALLAVGHTVHAVCPDKKAGDQIATAIHDFEGQQTYSEKRGHNFTLNATFDTVKAEDYDALVIPGGRAPEYLRMDDKVLAIVRHFALADKPIAAICHAPWLLIEADIVEGRTVTAWPSVRTDLENAGGKVVDQEVAIDGNLITSRNPDDIPAFSKALIAMLQDAKVAEDA